MEAWYSFSYYAVITHIAFLSESQACILLKTWLINQAPSLQYISEEERKIKVIMERFFKTS